MRGTRKVLVKRAMLFVSRVLCSQGARCVSDGGFDDDGRERDLDTRAWSFEYRNRSHSPPAYSGASRYEAAAAKPKTPLPEPDEPPNRPRSSSPPRAKVTARPVLQSTDRQAAARVAQVLSRARARGLLQLRCSWTQFEHTPRIGARPLKKQWTWPGRGADSGLAPVSEPAKPRPRCSGCAPHVYRTAGGGWRALRALSPGLRCEPGTYCCLCNKAGLSNPP